MSISWRQFKIDLQDGGHLGCLIRSILAIFICKLSRYFLPSFESSSLSIHEKRKIDFQDRCHLGSEMTAEIQDGCHGYFYLQVSLIDILPTKFRVNCPFGSEKRKIDFQDGCHGVIISKTFSESMGHSRAGNYHAKSQNRAKIELIQDFMSVPVICNLMKIQTKMKSLPSGQSFLNYMSNGD